MRGSVGDPGVRGAAYLFVRIYGAVSDPSLTAITFSFWHEDIDKSVHFEAPVNNGRFSKTVLFTHAQAGVHQLAINRQRGDTSFALPQDSFSPFVVTQGEGPVLLPVDFFEGIRLDAPLPIEFRIGQPVRVVGAISDPAVSHIEFSFSTFDGDTEAPWGLSDTRFIAQVVDNRFSMDIAFSREQRVSENYSLDVRLLRNGQRSAARPRMRTSIRGSTWTATGPSDSGILRFFRGRSENEEDQNRTGIKQD